MQSESRNRCRSADEIVAGGEPAVGDSLKQTSELPRPILLLALIGVEIDVCGQTPDECLRDYVRRFPEHEELIRSEFASADSLDETVKEAAMRVSDEPVPSTTVRKLFHWWLDWPAERAEICPRLVSPGKGDLTTGHYLTAAM